jgi:hypothetical protein
MCMTLRKSTGVIPSNSVLHTSLGLFFKNILTRLAGHILRLLATHHIVREVKPDVFGINRISGFMDTGKDARALFAS